MYFSLQEQRQIQRLRGAARLAARSPAGTSSAHAAVLDLQRDAGNKAVARLLEVQRQERTPRTAESSGAKLGDSASRSSALGPPPQLADKDEADYRAKGESMLSGLGGGSTSTTAGHTTVGPIEGFPEWFAKLQSALVGSQEWRADKEEPAQNLLADYALKRYAVPYQGDTSKVPPTVRIFLQHIGRSTSNVKAADAAKLRSSRALGGAEGAKNWCAQAGSSSVKLALQAAGLTVDTAKTNWNDWLIGPPVPKVYMQEASVEGRIEPGDQVSYLEAAILAVGGHTVTALSGSRGEGTTFQHASGNAGGGSSGSVRLGSSPPRAKLPANIAFSDIQAKTGKDLGAPAGKVWVYVIVKYSRFWDDLGAIDIDAPNVWQSKAGKDFLAKYKLAPGKIST